MTDLAEIEAALAAATPGPWEASANDSGHSRFEMNHYVLAGPAGDFVCDMESLTRVSINERVAKDEGEADAHLIANAPTWLAELVERVKVAEADRDSWRAIAGARTREVEAAEAERDSSVAEVQRLTATLNRLADA